MLPMLTAANYYCDDMNVNMVIADRLLTWQTDGGGWGKDIHNRPDPKNDQKVLIDRAWDAKEPRSRIVDQSGNETGTLENGATVNEMILLAKVYRETGDRRYKDALVKAVDYLLDMQYANGGWPLTYPLLGNDTDRITFDGAAMIRAMKILSLIERTEYPFDYVLLDAVREQKLKESLQRGFKFIECTLTAWGKHHDPETDIPNHDEDRVYGEAVSTNSQNNGQLKVVPENRYAEQVENKIIPLADITADTLIVVAKDGSGDYVDVQAAIDAVPADNTKPVAIYIKEGLYHQKLVIPKNKPMITLVGENKFRTILTYLDITGTGFNGGSTIVEADDFTALNLTFANEAGAIGTAAALEVRGDRGYFEGVRLLGYQDTLYLNSKQGGRFYFHDCYIEGPVDFIYGPATAFLENCVIFNKRSGGYITAASTPKEQKYGIIFLNCTITGYPWVKDVYFGRPWRDYANDVFLHSLIEEGVIHPQGWHNWGSLDKEQTARYREYGSYGPGADIRLRANWTKQLSSDEAMEYTAKNILSGKDGWAPTIKRNVVMR